MHGVRRDDDQVNESVCVGGLLTINWVDGDDDGAWDGNASMWGVSGLT